MGVIISATNVLANQYWAAIYRNGSIVSTGQAFAASSGVGFRVTARYYGYFNAGDYIEPYFYGAGNNSANTLTTGTGTAATYLSVTRQSGPATIAASEKIYLNYTNNGATSLTANTTNIDWTTKVVDSHGAWSGTVFTAPRPSMYTVAGGVRLSAASAPGFVVYKNGSAVQNTNISASAQNQVIQGRIYLVAGDTLSIRSDTNVTLANSTNVHWISITSQE